MTCTPQPAWMDRSPISTSPFGFTHAFPLASRARGPRRPENDRFRPRPPNRARGLANLGYGMDRGPNKARPTLSYRPGIAPRQGCRRRPSSPGGATLGTGWRQKRRPNRQTPGCQQQSFINSLILVWCCRSIARVRHVGPSIARLPPPPPLVFPHGTEGRRKGRALRSWGPLFPQSEIDVVAPSPSCGLGAMDGWLIVLKYTRANAA